MKLDSKNSTNVHPYVKAWLILGVILVFCQIVIGGITRLTGSGLSITKWEIITGTFPPLQHSDWENEFLKYQATPQYKKINQGMSLADFKFIYFWEYFHRLWARMMGFIFAIPFLFFWRKGWLSVDLMKRLSWVILAAALAATFGWIMVKSGLSERPWVNAYKLSIHLTLGFTVLGLLLWAVFFELFPQNNRFTSYKFLRKVSVACFTIALLQFIFGGLMSGMKAGLFFNSWPDMHGTFIPKELYIFENWSLNNMKYYDKNPFAPALIQFIHRNLGYLVGIFSVYLSILFFKSNQRNLALFILATVFTQITLGVFTLINCVGTIPVSLGVFHQAGGVILLSVLLYANYLTHRD